LCDRGLHPLLMDRADEVGASWRGRYDRLKLNTGRDYSHLPERPYPKGTLEYPTRADVVEHLHRHAHEDGIELCWVPRCTESTSNLAAGGCRPPAGTSTPGRSFLGKFP
jgi:hypothetical protein